MTYFSSRMPLMRFLITTQILASLLQYVVQYPENAFRWPSSLQFAAYRKTNSDDCTPFWNLHSKRGEKSLIQLYFCLSVLCVQCTITRTTDQKARRKIWDARNKSFLEERASFQLVRESPPKNGTWVELQWKILCRRVDCKIKSRYFEKTSWD